MSLVLEAALPEKNLTTSHQDDDWLNFIESQHQIIKVEELCLPELSMPLNESSTGDWFLINGETSASERALGHVESNIFVEIESPLMPPQRRFRINLKITSIRKGQPSICDEVEL